MNTKNNNGLKDCKGNSIEYKEGQIQSVAVPQNKTNDMKEDLPEDCQSKDDGVCWLPINTCKECEQYDVAVPIEIKEGDKVKCLYRDSGHKFWKDQFDKGLTVDKVFLKDNVPNELRFKEIPNQLFYSNDFVAVPVEKDINIKVLFSVFKNEDRKQFEFTPKVNGYTSYTVSFKECDNEEDAYKAVYKSITAEARRGAEKILADVAVPIQKDFCFNCYEDVPIKLIENSKVCTICDHLINPMQSKPIVEDKVIEKYLKDKCLETFLENGQNEKYFNDVWLIAINMNSLLKKGLIHAFKYQSKPIVEEQGKTADLNILSIYDALNEWVNSKDRETIPRKDFLEVAKYLNKNK